MLLEIQAVQNSLQELETQLRQVATDLRVPEQVIDTLNKALQINKQPATDSTPDPNSADPNSN